MIIERRELVERIRLSIDRNPVTILTGPRQSGKTTLARMFVPEDSANYFDLEDPISILRLEEPRTALESLRGLIVIDEVQRRPDLFPILRVLADRSGQPAKFLILGSAAGDLLRQSSEVDSSGSRLVDSRSGRSEVRRSIRSGYVADFHVRGWPPAKPTVWRGESSLC